MALNPIVFTEKVVRSFLRYQLTAYPFADVNLHCQMRQLRSGGRATLTTRYDAESSRKWA